MKKYLFILSFLTIACLAGSCEYERADYWTGGDHVRFYDAANPNNLDDDYVAKPTGNTSLNPGNLQSVVTFDLQVMGDPSDKPRKVKMEQYEDEALQGSSLIPVEGVNFEWPEDFVIQPGEVQVQYPVTIKSDPNAPMGLKTYKLLFRLVESEDLTPIGGYNKAELSFSQVP